MQEKIEPTLRFLHLEDNPKDAELIENILTDGGIDPLIILVKLQSEFAHAIRHERFDLILSDYSIPSFSGSDALAITREASPDTPFIFVSGTIGEDAAIESLHDGATDYVLKTKLTRLVPAVKRALKEADEKKKLKFAEKMREIALEDLKASEEQFRGIYEYSPVGILSVDAQGKILHCNPAVTKLLGYDENELTRMTFDDVTYEGDSAISRHLLESLLSGEKGTVDFEKRCRRKDGKIVWAHVTASAIHDTHGRFVRTETIIEDISVRKEAEEALRQSEERYRGLVDGARDTIFSVSVDGIIQSLNPAFEQMTGWTREEWIGRNYSDLVHREDIAKAMSALDDFLKGRETGRVSEYRILKSTGEYMIAEFNGTTQKKDGRIIGFLGVGRDITAQRTLEERFRQAEKLESLGTLVGGIAHDFNNILGIILGYASFLRRSESEGSQLAQKLELIESAARRGVGVVRQLLTFARKQVRTVQPVSVNDVVNEVYKMVLEIFPKLITINTDLSTGLLVVMGDQTEIHRAILNLCVNARDAMMDRTDRKLSGGILRLSTSVVEGEELRGKFAGASGRSYVEIAVTDTGVGMDDKTKAKIFDPFFTTKEKGKGTGLGLSSVFGIVQGHEGFIDVESRLGSGTAIRLFFPRRGTGKEEDKDAVNQASEVQGGGETILVVEDEPGLRELLNDILANSGYKVLTAADGQRALALFLNYRDIRLMLSDIGVPQIGGVDLLESVKRIRPKAKVILTSGFVEEEEREKMFAKGVSAFIQKPYLPEDVLRKVRDALDGVKPS